MDFDIKQIEEFKKVIEDIIDARIQSYGLTSFISAIVTVINDDGTVNVKIPPDNTRTVSNILNKSGETLNVGDSVELCTKNGKISNSWIAVKHGKNVSGGSIEERIAYLEQNALIFTKTGEYNE